jgi:hypothetical protein
MSGSETINVTPCQGLNDQQNVTITGSGFTPSGDVTFFMCKAEPASANDCDGTDIGTPTADANGEINDTFTVLKSFATDGDPNTTITCNNGSPSPNCSVLATDGDDATVAGAFMDVGFGTAATTTTSAGSSTSTTTGSSTTSTTSGSTTTSTTSPAATCPTGGVTSSPSVTVNPADASPGDDVDVSGKGFPANTKVNIELCSSPVQLITATIDGSGNLAATTVTIPANAALGAHEIVVLPANGSPVGIASLTLVSAGSGSGSGAVASSPVATPVAAEPSFTG